MAPTLGVAWHDWDAAPESTPTEIRRAGFDRVFLCVEERHINWRQGNVSEMIDRLHDAGLSVWLDPWGVGGMFAGEATGTDASAFDRWADFACCSAADGVLLDEPRDLDLPHWRSRLSKSLALAVAPERAWQPHGVELSVSTYNFGPSDWGSWERRLLDWSASLPDTASAWVQTFRVPASCSRVPGSMIRFWLDLGRDVNVWSWDATRTVSEIRPDDPDAVWRGVLDAISDQKEVA